MKKKEILEEIKLLAPMVNKAIMDLERTGYAESSFAYDRIEQLRFDGYDFMNKKGQFRISSKLTKAELEEELSTLQKLSQMQTLTPQRIVSFNEKARKSFNAKMKEEGKAPLSKKAYAKLRHDFAEMQNLKLNEIVSSDTIIELSKMTTRAEAEAMYRSLENEEKQEEIIRDFMNQKRQKGRNAESWSVWNRKRKKAAK